ncbi:MAG: DUF3883 domain-containing protein [bacterium]
MKIKFSNIKVANLECLCRIVSIAKIRRIEFVNRKYSERGTYFDETLSFLVVLNVIKISGNEVIPKNEKLIKASQTKEFNNILLQTIFSTSSNTISQLLKDFLFNFQSNDSIFFFQANQSEKLKYSHIRNLLIELNFICLSGDKKKYVIDSKFDDLFYKIINKRKLTFEKFKEKQIENEQIGLLAEIAIIQFEQKRLLNIKINKNEIEHTSIINTLAGYDIRSFEEYFDSNSNRIFRYIEVKAVSELDYKFFWSRNEIEISKIYGDSYYLYLLPIKSKTKFNFESLEVIKNPYQFFFKSDNFWESQVEKFSFSKITN